MQEGLLIKERYQVIETIGKGGFGSTYLALDQRTEKKCVIKYIPLKISESIKDLDFFKREGKVLSGLNHPLIPKFIDSFTIETDQQTNFCLVQEYIKGKNFQQLIQEGKYFKEKEVIRIALDLVNVLEYLHNFSPPIIHRDIKPSNIILTPTGKTYLIDFGAVKDKLLNYDMPNQGLSTIIGTQGYMPIEQFEGKAVPASDIYSLGLTLIYLLSHKEPYQLEKKKLRLDYHTSVNISKEFMLILDKMIEPEWENRFQNVLEIKKKLQGLLNKAKKNKKKYKSLLLGSFSIFSIVTALSVYSFYSEKKDITPLYEKQKKEVKIPDLNNNSKKIAVNSNQVKSKNLTENLYLTEAVSTNPWLRPLPSPEAGKKTQKKNSIKIDKSSKIAIIPSNKKIIRDIPTGFVQRESFKENCYQQNNNFSCINFKDNFILLVNEERTNLIYDRYSEENKDLQSDNKIEVVRGKNSNYYHILGTTFVKATNKSHLEKIDNNTSRLFVRDLEENSTIAMDGKGNFVIVWEAGDTSSLGIFAQRYNSYGIPHGQEIRVNDTLTGSQDNPVIAMNKNGSFVIAWASNEQTSSGRTIYAKKFNNNGIPHVSEFRVNNLISFPQEKPAIAIDDKGNFIITWSGRTNEGYGIFAKRYSDIHSKPTEFMVSSSKYYNLYKPNIAVNNNGKFVVVWQEHDEDNNGIFARQFNNNTKAFGNTLRVNTYTVDKQENPRVAIDKSENFIVTWQSYGQDESLWGIFARKFKNGVPQGKEFPVNTIKTDSQMLPDITMDERGNFLILWQNIIDYKSNIFIQKFNALGKPNGNEIKINNVEFNNYREKNVRVVSNQSKAVASWNNGRKFIYIRKL